MAWSLLECPKTLLIRRGGSRVQRLGMNEGSFGHSLKILIVNSAGGQGQCNGIEDGSVITGDYRYSGVPIILS